MFEKITDVNEIKKYREEFLNILKKDTEKTSNLNIPDPGGDEICDVYWSEKYKYWVAHPVNDEAHEGHYRNIFGLEKPEINTNITVSINLSKNGKTNTQGLLAKDITSGAVCLFHNGSITINALKKYSNHKQSIINIYKGRVEDVRGRQLILIGELSSEKFLENVIYFINEVANIKNEIIERELKETNNNVQKEKKDINKEIITISKQSPIIKSNTLDDLIDNVIRVKIGLRILLKALEPIVINELKNVYKDKWWDIGVKAVLNEEQKRGLKKDKLDITLCFSLIYEKHWDKIFKNKINVKYNQENINSAVRGSKVYRNVNAHDYTQDITYEEAEISLKHMSLLCKAFDAIEASKNIERIIHTLQK